MRTTAMSSQNHKKYKYSILRNNKGFTLIELAIVLVIIGLILGSVLKGKDLINSAKQKNFYNSFLKNWQLSIASYSDRTGFLLGDGTLNGGTQVTTNGNFDVISGATFGAANGIDATLKKVGLEVPVTNTAISGQYSFKGAYSGSVTINMYLHYLTSATDGRASNAFYLQTVPTDLAIALDKIIDGQMNSTNGKFRLWPDNTLTNGSWPDASTTNTVNATFIIDF